MRRIAVDTRLWRIARWGLVVLVLAVVVKAAVRTVRGGPGFHNVPFDAWYGDWREVLVATAIFLAFLLGFARPRRPAEWRSAGLYAAFLISLYLLAPALGLPVTAFGMNESHLWAFTLDRLGVLPLRWGVFVVMAISTVLIAGGIGLLAVGWATVYRGRGGLVTGGIYRWLRHPQYAGLILVVIAFNLMWPTLPTLVMAPVLVVMYVRLARREDRKLAERFGWPLAVYAARTPAFVPWARGRLSRDVWPIGWEDDARRDSQGHCSGDVPGGETAGGSRSSEPLCGRRSEAGGDRAMKRSVGVAWTMGNRGRGRRTGQ
jgi:protein-S-isoprenylcysteine O-methyltransferase Ste14